MSTENIVLETLPPEGIILDAEVKGRRGVFELAGELFERVHRIPALKAFEHLLERERLVSTAIGHGMAVPHARIDDLSVPMAVAIRLRSAIEFDAPDNEAVSLFFCLLVPQVATQQHLDILAKISEKLSDQQNRSALLAAGSVDEFRNILGTD